MVISFMNGEIVHDSFTWKEQEIVLGCPWDFAHPSFIPSSIPSFSSLLPCFAILTLHIILIIV